MPQQLPNVTRNYNRAVTPFSRFGTRRLQYYRIRIYGVSDADSLWNEDIFTAPTYADYVAALAVVGITVDTADSHYEQYTWPNGSIYSAILNGVSDVAEIYYTGYLFPDRNDPDDNDIIVTVLVAEDTFMDGEMPGFRGGYPGAGPNDYSTNMISAVYNRIESFDWVDIDVTRVELVGDGFYASYDPSTGGSADGGYAMKRTEPASTRISKAQVKASLKRSK